MGVRAWGLCEWERFEEGSMKNSKLRLLGMSALVGAGLMATGPAGAYELRLGGVDVRLDTVYSAGVSVRVADRETKLLPQGNGGPVDERVLFETMTSLISPDLSSVCSYNATEQASDATVIGNNCWAAVGDDNYDSSINTDDGRLNFDNGDLTGGTLKFTTDISADLASNITAFARANVFYDAVLSSDSSYERGGLNGEADDYTSAGIELLDAYVDFNASLGGQDILVRAGKQVINWGEATFFLGGNSSFNAIDVAAIRRPGAEIKEALLPVEALYFSTSLPYDLSLEAYVGGWDKFKLDVGGTPFANSDGANVDAVGDLNGNNGKVLIGGGVDAGGNKMNCNLAATQAAAGMSATADLITYIRANATTGIEDCTETSFQHFNRYVKANETVEDMRRSYDFDDATMPYTTEDPDSEESYGIALRWYSAALNSTEFGFYYQNYTSRIPYAQAVGKGAQIGVTTVGAAANNVTRQGVHQGELSYCDNTLGQTSGVMDAAIGNTASDVIKDPTGIFAAFRGYVNDNAAPGTLTAGTTFLDMMKINCALSGGDDSTATASRLAPAGIPASLLHEGTGLGQKVDAGNPDVPSALLASAYNPTAEYAATGTMFLDIAPVTDINLIYPENIEKVGMSFNTTLFGTGVQADVSYSHNFPIALDGDALVISGFTSACTFQSLGAIGIGLYYDKRSMQSVACNEDNPGVYEADGFVREGITFFDIGTTSLFNGSNPVISALGANSGVVLTEFAAVYMDDMDKYRVADADLLEPEETPYGRLVGACTSGSDLGLGSLVALDDRPDNFCRPTSSSAAAILLAGLTYSNFMGTAFTVSPRFIHRVGLHGIAPRPAAAFTEGVSSTALSVNLAYQDWSSTVSYVDYQDDEDGLFSRSIDQDTLSISVTRSF